MLKNPVLDGGLAYFIDDADNGSYYGARQIVRCNTVLTVLGGVGGIMVV